jgi:hypothetical protein
MASKIARRSKTMGDKAATESVYLTIYTNKWPDDGFEIGGVYATEALAEEAAENHTDVTKMSELGWENVAVVERELEEHER